MHLFFIYNTLSHENPVCKMKFLLKRELKLNANYNRKNALTKLKHALLLVKKKRVSQG